MRSSRSPETPRPFLKWAGGKTQLLSQFQALYPAEGKFARYLEPFVGSAAVFFQVRQRFAPSKVILADGNEELINAYRVIQENVEALIRMLGRHRLAHDAEHYYRVRAMRPAAMTPLARAARLIYLNKTCFNGLYRVNSRGGFNVPMGRYDDPPIQDAPNLRSVSEALRGVTLKTANFRETLSYARKGDFLYFDPPYQPISATSFFTSYTNGSFTEKHQADLAAVYRTLDARGCLLMLSNSDASLIHRLYRGFDVRQVDARRSINSKAEKRGRVSEVVVLNYTPSSESASPGRRAVGTVKAKPRGLSGAHSAPGPKPSRPAASRLGAADWPRRARAHGSSTS